MPLLDADDDKDPAFGEDRYEIDLGNAASALPKSVIGLELPNRIMHFRKAGEDCEMPAWQKSESRETSADEIFCLACVCTSCLHIMFLILTEPNLFHNLTSLFICTHKISVAVIPLNVMPYCSLSKAYRLAVARYRRVKPREL